MEEGFLTGDNSTFVTTETYNCTHVTHPYKDITENIIKYTSIFIAPFGIPGNILAFLVWIQPPMRCSSGVYLALLAVTQTMVLAGRIIYDLEYGWQVSVTDYPVVCEMYVVLFYLGQYQDTLLYLAFTVDRYICVYHPFRRRQLCTIKRAIYVSISLACLSLATSSMQAYLITNNEDIGCAPRNGVSKSFWNIWSFITESAYFLFVPVTVLVMNILVLRAVNQSRNRLNVHDNNTVSSSARDETVANLKLLLYVSFYFIMSVLPVSIFYLLWTLFPPGEACVVEERDNTWIAYRRYILTKSIVETVTLLHYAINFYIYMYIGKIFRKEFRKLMSNCIPDCMLGRVLVPTPKTHKESHV